jgi:hypothetical protein
MLQYVAARRREVTGTQRLDGLVTGVTADRPIARFDHGGYTWDVDGDTHFEPIEVAHAALRAEPASEPFEIGRTGTRLKLVLRPDLEALRHDRGTRNAAYLYVYAKPHKA